MTNRVLFILKRKEDYNGMRDGGHIGLSTGLYNSASYVVEMLKKQVSDVKLVVVTDNNDIDREVTLYKPTHVIIEALWVVPEKFDILTKLHPKVSWFVRLHSATPFLAGEGIAMEWISKYVEYPNVYLMANDPRMVEDVKTYLSSKDNWWNKSNNKPRIIYTPNYYPVDNLLPHRFTNPWTELHVGCFGAVRPLKNHLSQAIASVKAANKLNKKLFFHINSSRIEGRGEPVLKNITSMFEQLGDRYTLVNHPWLTREEFLKLSRKMDVGLQVSFTETFNIVSADMVSQGVPVVTSSEVPWTYTGIANPVDTDNIANHIVRAYNSPKINVFVNQIGLKWYSNLTERVWNDIDWNWYKVK